MAQNAATYPFPYSKAAQLDGRIKLPRPVIDPALVPMIDSYLFTEQLDLDFMRGVANNGEEDPIASKADAILKDAPHLMHEEHTVLRPEGNIVILSVFRPKKPTSDALPALYHIHGGGMVAGDRFTAISEFLDLAKDIECVVVSVEYRLAPETRAPGPAEDCYAGLIYVMANAADLGIDPTVVVVWGVSGGAALAAVVCMMARDKKLPAVPPIKAQMLLSPMLDDRCESVSDQQFEYGSPWPSVWNRAAWTHIVGEDRGSDRITAYQSPSRAEDLAGLPPAYIDVGECDVFRDPAVAYAMNMWRCGSTCELHVWPGAFHLFDGMDSPEVPLIHAAIETKKVWLKRIMQPAGVEH